jgi:hypothetical protein
MFQKGVSGNPKGRPRKGRSLSEALEEVLKKKGPDGKPNYKALSEKLVQLAKAGDTVALKYIFDRVEGRPTETAKIAVNETIDPSDAAKKLEALIKR